MANKENKHAIIGTWTNQDGTKQWDLLAGPITLEDAKEAIPTIKAKEEIIEQEQFTVSWEIYKLMIETLNT